MDELLQKRLLAWLKRLDRTKLSRSIGTVTATSPLTVEIGGESHEGLAQLTGYTPSIGHRVYVLRSGRDLTVLGEVG